MSNPSYDGVLLRGTDEHYAEPPLYEHEYRRRRHDVRYYVALAGDELAPDGEVLDLCCGSGRVTRALLRGGFAVTGVDRNEAMLSAARDSVQRLPLRCRPHARFVQADMRDFDLGRQFGLIVSAFNSIEHLYTYEDIEQALASIKRHLAPHGRFAFDVQMPDLVWLSKDPDKRWARTRFRHPVTRQWLVYSTNQRYDPVAQIAHIRLFYDPLEPGPMTGSRVLHLTQRKFFPAELAALLRHAGFEVLRHDGDFDGDVLDDFAQSQVLVCRHAGEGLG